MELTLQDAQQTVSLSDAVFKKKFNEALVHQVIVAHAAGARQGTHAQKSRAEVSGSSKKPWRQKGTGRARSGSVKSPIWRSGGVTFGAKTQDYSQKVNKKMYRGAIKSILSELIRRNRLIIVTKFFVEAPKTKILVQRLKEMKLKSALIISNALDKNLILSARNLYKVETRDTRNIDPISLLAFDAVIITVEAIKRVEEIVK